MNKYIKHIALCGCVAAGLGLTSCEDFLSITPTDRIVEEEFWQDKRDLENAVFGCYKQFTGYNMLTKYIYWGEERSDNFDRSQDVQASGQIANIMNANLLPTYDQFDWLPAYQIINSCNKVLAHGPQIVESDESFSDKDWKPIEAEMKTLRALAHFILVRTFGEIPYVEKDYNNDSEVLSVGQTTQLDALNRIIADLESIKDNTIEDYGNTVSNKGRITKKAVWALLADVYLWRASYIAGGNQPFKKVGIASNYQGELTEAQLSNRTETYPTSAEADYQKCVEYCDRVIDMATEQYIKQVKESGLNVGGAEIKVTLGHLLEQSGRYVNGTLHIAPTLSAYNSLFGTCNSDESIFELQYDGLTYGNYMITTLFYNIKDGKNGQFVGAQSMFEGVDAEVNTTEPSTIYTKTDMRYWENVRYTGTQQTVYPIGKFINRSVIQQSSSSVAGYVRDNQASNMIISQSSRSSSNVNANFPIYRLSEIYLMKAEAMSQLYADEENLYEAFRYVREVFARSNPYAYALENTSAKDSLEFKGYFDQPESLEKLVLIERQREFVGEGKRWFDLVRYAQRYGTTSKMLPMLVRKYSNNQKAVKAKLADMQSLFSPVYNQDIKNNPLLYQNGVWSVNETSSMTDKL